MRIEQYRLELLVDKSTIDWDVDKRNSMLLNAIDCRSCLNQSTTSLIFMSGTSLSLCRAGTQRFRVALFCVRLLHQIDFGSIFIACDQMTALLY